MDSNSQIAFISKFQHTIFISSHIENLPAIEFEKLQKNIDMSMNNISQQGAQTTSCVRATMFSFGL